MKEKIIYTLTFTAAFILITAAIIFLNSQYQNIFKFDFTPVDEISEVQINYNADISDPVNIEEIKNSIADKIKSELLDTLKSALPQKDTIKNTAVNDSLIMDSLKALNVEISKIKSRVSVYENKDSAATHPVQDEDSTYLRWAKTTAGLYESMDSRKAAKIIQNYSDNTARDILYAMKKKKAAEILAELNPETANRITRVR